MSSWINEFLDGEKDSRDFVLEAGKSVSIVSTIGGYVIGRADGAEMTYVEMDMADPEYSVPDFALNPFDAGYSIGLNQEQKKHETISRTDYRPSDD